MNTLIPITQTDDRRQAVSGRALHEFLEVKAHYKDWLPRMVAYGFIEGQDYVLNLERVARQGRGTIERQDHILTLDMAKELSMIQRTERGRQARAYFPECEKRAQQGTGLSELDEARIVQRAIQVQYQKIQELEARELENAPKVDYHDDFVADDDLLTFSTVASRLGIKESHLRELLIEHKWIYKETRTRWSQSKKRKVTRYRYTECADKKDYFERNRHHDVPRFGGQVMYTLMITPAGAVPVSRAVRKWMGGQGELEVISGGAA